MLTLVLRESLVFATATFCANSRKLVMRMWRVILCRGNFYFYTTPQDSWTSGDFRMSRTSDDTTAVFLSCKICWPAVTTLRSTTLVLWHYCAWHQTYRAYLLRGGQRIFTVATTSRVSDSSSGKKRIPVNGYIFCWKQHIGKSLLGATVFLGACFAHDCCYASGAHFI